MKITFVTDIESHVGFSKIRDLEDYQVHGVDIKKVIITATDTWKDYPVGSISVGFSPTFDQFIALKD